MILLMDGVLDVDVLMLMQQFADTVMSDVILSSLEKQNRPPTRLGMSTN